jgi:superoxide dismutase, Cu-Zn family
MKRTILVVAILMTAGAFAVAGPSETPSAKAELNNAHGEFVANAKLTQAPEGVKISLRVAGLEPGTHAFHIHSVGKCDAPDFKSAGGHFNPEAKKHGLKNAEGPHAGDMENIEVGSDGTGQAEVINPRVTLGEGKNSLFQPGGTSLVIHEKADDMTSDPAGNAGARVACGVIEKTEDGD